MATIETLYEQVTAAILCAERIHQADVLVRRLAFSVVSDLEEQIAHQLPADDVEGAIARRGAVMAAMCAGDPSRAKALSRKYIEEGVSDELQQALIALAKEGGKT